MKFILGKKLDMLHFFDEKGSVIPVTLVEAGPCEITQIKNKDSDKYEAIQIGFKRIEKKNKIKKTMKGKEFKYLRELRLNEGEGDKLKIKDVVDVSVFQEGDKVKISGICKGKGFSGAVKRWGFKGRLSSTHGTKHELRTLGSVGCSFPERVIKGRKMAGRMGGGRITVKNLKIIKIDKENNLMVVMGAIPGQKGGLLEIRG